MRQVIFFILFVVASKASADWFYYVIKIECNSEEFKVINYSAYNEEGRKRGKENGVIDVDKLSTWRTTPDGLNIPDKSAPHIEECTTNSGKYRIIIENEGGGYSAPYPVIYVDERSVSGNPNWLINRLSLEYRSEKYIKELVFSAEHPEGIIVYGKAP